MTVSFQGQHLVLKPNLVSVVEKMFLQIKVDERDQDALRYLWRDLKSDDPPRIYR